MGANYVLLQQMHLAIEKKGQQSKTNRVKS